MGLPDREVYRKATENFGSKIARVYELSHISDPA